MGFLSVRDGEGMVDGVGEGEEEGVRDAGWWDKGGEERLRGTHSGWWVVYS